ncbi:multiple sugar transport system ATP-binding protein [Desulfocicer vacuolatum DSM 3385]|uniref:Multiple sugar transport system ATP-binding protein n=1 Tax=Desulfocicer vacuolatum DSM 3385 TaxID=1121400 RepID=A0A1W2EWI6_9BACT|nr:ATP-binding cassette domain-containing protein [Desulfocicer vacuolatum]SMD14065.1 multiple sugar transport system ATP-binding protein [Desulfocicer vacuolatum DSM 3385]
MFLKCRGLGYRYPRSSEFVFQDISFALDTPGFHALFGPSGVGKTSFAKLLTGDITGYTGEIHKKKDTVFLYTYNQERLPGWSSIGRHLEKVTPPGMNDLCRELVDTFAMEPFMNQKFSQLSLGQQNRINLIRYLLQEFDLLVMDESLANVDERSKENIIFKIKELFPQKYFLYISHNLMEVSKFSDAILVLLKAGKHPQTSLIKGLNIHRNDVINSHELDGVLLGIMNAC